MIETISKYALVAVGAKDPKNVVIPNGQAYTLVAISLTAPYNGKAATIISFDGDIIDAAQGDKFAQLGHIEYVGDNVKVFKIDLDNLLGTVDAFLGATVYYEKNG